MLAALYMSNSMQSCFGSRGQTWLHHAHSRARRTLPTPKSSDAEDIPGANEFQSKHMLILVFVCRAPVGHTCIIYRLVCMYLYVYIYIYTCIFTCICTCICMCIRTCVCVYVYVYVYVYMCIYICMCICIRICICIWQPVAISLIVQLVRIKDSMCMLAHAKLRRACIRFGEPISV